MFGFKKQKDVESYRPAAQSLDRHVYENILSIAFAPDATPEGNALAQRDPDGFVATYLRECDRTGVSVQEISDHFDEVRAFAEEHADEIEERAARMRGQVPEG
jgi:hypothetical protein